MFNKNIFEEIGKDIYVYKNFETREFCDRLFDEFNKREEKDWVAISDAGRYVSFEGSKNLKYIRDKILSTIELHDGFYLNDGDRCLRITKGGFMAPHADNVEYLKVLEESKNYVDGQEYELRQNSHYGMVFYFNEFEGGELEYPNQNIIYKPNVGDLVIHSSLDHCTHGVKTVLNGERYSYSSNIYDFIKVPKGTNVHDFRGLGAY